MTAIPRFDELPVLADTDERHTWGVFGTADELGCLNFITDEVVAAAASLIQTGERVSLNLPLGTPARPFWAPSRANHPLSHQILQSGRTREDYLDSFFLQGTTQWDALSHRGYRQHGYYGGRDEADLDNGALGIDTMAKRGIIGRGVLVDVAGHLAAQGTVVSPTQRVVVDAAMLDAILEAQRVTLADGDVLLIRTGWLSWFLGLSDAEIDEQAARFESDRASLAWPGVSPLPETVAWLWNHRVAAIAVDNPTVEAIPYLPEEGYLHHRALAMMGLPLGELWVLDALAERCRQSRRYAFFLTSAPLALPGGAGSPANAYAVF